MRYYKSDGIINNVTYKSSLHFSDGLRIDLNFNKPNWWWRLWQWIFFGFSWKDYEP